MTVKHYYYDESLEMYRVYKFIKGKCYRFGNYKHEASAIKKVKKLKENNWDGLYKPVSKRKMQYPEDIDLIERICHERNIAFKTKETYYQAIIHYSELLGESFTNLIKIYSDEEYKKHWKERRLKTDLINYRNYLANTYQKNTVRIYFNKIKTILRHLEIEISYLPTVNNKNIKDLPPITYNDLLTKDNLRDAYNIANPLMRAVILFESSSGCARRETLNLTVKDYLEANNINMTDDTVKTLLLDVDSDFVPTFKVRRQKTNKYYLIYCTPQANKELLNYLINREALFLDSPLFDVNLYYWNHYFNDINNRLGLGQVRNYNKFRSHMLRKWNASTLYNNGMSMDDVDSLQGRGKDSTHQSYFMDDPELLRQKYMDYMDCLLLEV